ncbi:hypothetical protein Molly3_80 [Maribacter phage Molly_3]|uniref:Tail protein n=1 Tax=Maribacter phage Molly_1 TaxID=2745685 RepID=A0A8E4UYF9_9CAUD|nr:tail completion or Neck1 protein [Maribacter phage Molly_1]QQO97567.1 hypothetical protein Molly1_80 [Maribacter phage Molly_1]QQO97767.1 hypothetical protein Molly2_80 [Maribacter phage Molly_2]QQO97967.1 hypothetical protein Molly3_80 [Maribacter phage Molly_3]
MLAVRLPKNLTKKVRALKKLANLNEEFVEENIKAFAEMFYNRLMLHIENQDLGWRPLSTDYLEWKRSEGKSTKIWVKDGVLQKEIKLMRITDENLWFVGIDGTATYPDSDIPVSMIAAVMEYGSPSKGIPARPLFRPSRQEVIKEIKVIIERNNQRFLAKLKKEIG